MGFLEKVGLSNPEQEDSTKIEADFDENCYLAAQAAFFVEKHFRLPNTGRKLPTPWNTVFMANNIAGRGPNGQLNPSIPSRLMNRLDLTDFVYAEPKLFSLLYPKIELYRVDYVNDSIVDRLFLIPQETNNKYSVYQDVLNKKIAGAGIKSINWTIAGSNPAAAEKLVDLEINFEFSNALELGGGELNNILQHYVKGDPFPFTETDGDKTTNNFLSLILHPQGKRDEYNGKFYRLKAKLGWQYVTEDMLQKIGYSGDKAKKLAISLSKQSIIIMLNLISHSFDITEEGTVSLQTKYQASFEQAVDSGVFDIFYKHNIKKQELKENKTLKRIQSRISSINALLDASCAVLTNEQKDALRKTSLQNLRDELKEEQDKQRGTLKELEIQAKNSFMRLLFNEVNDFKAYNFTVGNEDIEAYEQYLEDINNGNQKPILKPPEDTTITTSLTLDDEVDLYQGEYNIDAQSEKILDKADAAFAGAFGGSIIEGLSKSAEFVYTGVDGEFGEKVWVSFVYLYDILNILYINLAINIEDVYGKNSIESNRLLLELSRYKIVLGDYKTVTGEIINLGELPISFTVFHEWYMNNIAKTDVTNYTLQSFVYSLFNDIIAKSLGASCVNGANLDNKVSIGFVTYSLEHKINEEPLNKIANAGYVNIGADKPYNKYINSLVPPDDSTTEKETTNYLYVYSKQLGCELEGDINQDLGKGIYHFYIGQAEGIHKSIKFKRIDQPYLKEARATKEDSFVLGQLREVYNVDLTTVGNTVFYPGMVIYIHPPIEFGAVTEKNNFAYLMGVGGYYSVIKVQSVIDQDKFETSLECVYLSSGVCEEKDFCDNTEFTEKEKIENKIQKLKILRSITDSLVKAKDVELSATEEVKSVLISTEVRKQNTIKLIESYNTLVTELNREDSNLELNSIDTNPILVNDELYGADANGLLSLPAPLVTKIDYEDQNIRIKIEGYKLLLKEI